jgi:chromosome segregation ATPase
MPDTSGRLDRVEQRLGKVENRLGKVENRLGKVENRLGKVENRLGKVENRLGLVESQLGEVRRDLGGLAGRVDTLTGRVDTLDENVQKLWLLHEETSRQVELIAEVQVHHGNVLDQLVRDIEPLKGLPDLLHRVINNHESRITALEQRAGQ